LPKAAPDGPPEGLAAANRYLLKLAEPVEQGYVAFYEDTDGRRVDVYALRFLEGEPVPEPRDAKPWQNPEVARMRSGQTDVIVAGQEESECFRLVKRHIKSVLE
jgi:hypothetical protein